MNNQTRTNQLKICYIGGGSRNWAWVLMQDMIFEKEISGEHILSFSLMGKMEGELELVFHFVPCFVPGSVQAEGLYAYI
jgi:alpha-galactosidase/6-phospho-beta-glucosidase family protein